jgi:hypothetical protein
MSFDSVPSTSAVASNLAPFRTNADDLVNERFQYALDYADQAFADALEVFDSIKQMAGDIDTVSIDLMLEDYDLNTPDFSSFSIPDPEDYGVEVGQLDPPTLSFNWNDESIYTSDLLSELKSKCSTDMAGGTGISSSVENDMINRETERDTLINQAAVTNVEADFAEYGWEMPDGVLGYNLTQVHTEYQNKRTDKSRDIRIESFNLAQKNIQFATGIASEVEKNLMTYQSGMMQRKLEAAKALIDGSVAIFRAQVEFLMSKAKIYETVVEAYKARIELEAEKAKVDIAIFDAKVRQVLGRAQVLIAKAQALISQYIEQNKLRLAAMEEAGKIAATVAAGALTGISAQAHISSSDQFSASGSVSYQGTEYIYRDETTI